MTRGSIPDEWKEIKTDFKFIIKTLKNGNSNSLKIEKLDKGAGTRWERTRQQLCRHAGTEVLLGHPEEHTEQAARERMGEQDRDQVWG